MKQDIRILLAKAIKEALFDLGLEEFSKEEILLDPPSDSRFGDLSTNIALKLARSAKSSPREIAAKLASFLEKLLTQAPAKGYVKAVKVEGAGFINFYLSEAYFYSRLEKIIRQGRKAIGIDTGKGKPVLIEFVSANPTGPLSVAHARQAVVGDVLANILNFCGFKAKKEYYLNDEGNQINILGRSIELRLRELNGETIEFPQDHYQGDYIYDIAREINEKKLQVKDFSEYGVSYILHIIKRELEDFGVRFDYWYSQKSLRQTGKIEKAFDFLKKKGLLYEQEGASWFKSTKFGDDKDRVVIKSDGSYTYLAPDIAYHRDKFRRGFQQLINLWGPDHHGYINRLKAAVAALGNSPEQLSVIIVQLASIFRDGKPVQMSTRRGQYITLQEVMDEVGHDASRFFFLMRRTSSHLDFDLGIAKKQTSENPVFYVQYAYARISSILRNAEELGHNPDKAARLGEGGFSVLKEDEELGLIRKICQLSDMLHICIATLDPYMLTVYLQELATQFHKFYDKHRVLTDDTRLSKARLALLIATRSVLALGLDLLGICKPEKM